MKTARPWLILFVAVALAGYGCASGSTTATTAPSNTPTTVSSAGTTTTTTTANPSSVGSAATSAPSSTTSAVAGTTAAAGSTAGLTSSLGSLGLSGDQSAGAVGSVLSMAQGKLSPTDYGKVAAAVPGASTYVEKAEAVNGGPVSKLGISPEIGAQVTPLVVNGISKMAGPTVGGLLSSVVK
jgi:uncharacterized protein VcgC/VcgE DUF2780